MPANALWLWIFTHWKTHKYLIKSLVNEYNVFNWWFWSEFALFQSKYFIRLNSFHQVCATRNFYVRTVCWLNWKWLVCTSEEKINVRVSPAFNRFFPHSNHASHFVTIYGHIWSSAPFMVVLESSFEAAAWIRKISRCAQSMSYCASDA